MMNTKFRFPLSVWQVALFIATLSPSMLAVAHNPLRDNHAEHHQTSTHSPNAQETRHTVNVETVRSLLVSFRETGDDRNLDEAWLLLKPALHAATANAETLVTAAFVAQSRHQFDRALALLDRAGAMNSNNDEMWLLRASIESVRGQTKAAAAACGQLRDVPLLVLLTCKARVELPGKEQESVYKRLAAVLSTDESRRLPPDMLAWSHSVAGDLAVASARSDVAIDHYRRSLAFAERTQVRAALVDVLLNSDKYKDEDTLQVLNAGSDALPLLVRRLIVAKRLNRLDQMQAILHQVQMEFDRWIGEEDWLHAREMARFYLDVAEQPDLARRLALINIKLQREPEDVRLEQRTRPGYARGERVG